MKIWRILSFMKIGASSLLVFSICLMSVAGWWDTGHMTVAQIATNYLKSTGGENALNKFTQLVEAFSNLTDGRTNSFVEASVWPDDIKDNNCSYFNDYHFTDVVYDPQNMFAAMTQFQKDVNSINVYNSAKSVLATNK